jgi:predicted component of type VI protein secretion system
VIQLQILSGKQADSNIVVCRFPFVAGRGADADLSLVDAGVWERHLQLDFERDEGFIYTTQPSALTLVNGERAERGRLHNGDVIELGSVRLRFWLARPEPKTLRAGEALTWAALLALFLAQIVLIVWLLR